MDVAFRRFSFNVLDGAQKVSAPRIHENDGVRYRCKKVNSVSGNIFGE
jgi:hypothetical protein